MKIIGSDYDGTLNYNGIDEEKKKALKKWRDAGNVFAVVSGRGASDILQMYIIEKFACDYLISNSGAVIMKTDGTIVSDIRCDGNLIVPLLRLLFENGCSWASIQSNNSYKIYADKKLLKEKGEYTLENMPQISYFNQISTALPNLETTTNIVRCIEAEFNGKLNPLQNGECIDIVREDINKTKGLYILMEHLGAKRDDVIVVGDNINDSDMIKEFKSYAMENGVESIKKLADYTTFSVTEMIERELNN